jgi:hypothetical protein
MSHPAIDCMLPSQRYKIAGLYREISKVYREALHLRHVPMLEDAARIAEMMADTFAKEINEPLDWKT